MKVKSPLNIEIKVKAKKKNKKTKKEELPQEPIDLDGVSLESFKTPFHNLLIEKIKTIYNTKNWKATFISKASKIHDYTVTYKELKNFEQLEDCNEDLLMLFILEIYFHQHKIKIRVNNQGQLKLH